MRHEAEDTSAPLAHFQPAMERSTRSQSQAFQFLLCRALVGLAAFDVLGFGRDFAKMHWFVSGCKVVQRKPSANTVERVCEAVSHACMWYPKHVLCLQRSAVTTCLLRYCGIPAKMVVGARNVPFKAHAWTEVDGAAVNERKDVHKIYQVLDCC